MACNILTLNSGSSSLKFAAFAPYDDDDGLRAELTGQVGARDGRIEIEATVANTSSEIRVVLSAGEQIDHKAALDGALNLVAERLPGFQPNAIGHRVVHGGPERADPVPVDDAVLAELERLSSLAPLHQPHNLAGVRAARALFPGIPQIACFDTAFHRTHPWVNDTFALPRDLYEAGIRRYGFHGLSYEYVTSKLKDIAPHHAAGRVIVAHLGNGASMCAIRDGNSVGSTMGFTALDGLPMGTRCGQLDPGVVLYMIDELGMSTEEVARVLYNRSGLKGLSGLSHDMRTLEEAATPEALQAIDYYVFRIQREIGAMTAILQGVDAIVFCGGIGEHGWRIRERVLQGVGWLGLELDEARNRTSAQVISSERSRIRVFVIPTNEELMIARHTLALLETR